ncbi:MAG: 30S ribosomal protein S16 [Flammeovirgaceae bacterium]|nr:30S ribosomal protein S16 [Flammeovirgaceae bacterium]
MVRIRLARRGRKKVALYDIVVADSRAPRDGKFIEKLGTYDPNPFPHKVTVNHERAVYWLMVGAQPTDTVRSLLSREGVMLRKHLQIGVNKGAITQEVADKRFQEWKAQKEQKLAQKIKEHQEKLARKKAEQQPKITTEAE